VLFRSWSITTVVNSESVATRRSYVTSDTRSVASDQNSCTLFSVVTSSSSGESNSGTVGGVVSTIVTNWVALAEFPDMSVAVQVTIVIPTGKPISDSPAPEASKVIWGDRSELSNTFGFPRETTVIGPVASVTISGGGVITGGVVSGPLRFTVTGVMYHHCWLLKKSVALETIVRVPGCLMFRTCDQVDQLPGLSCMEVL